MSYDLFIFAGEPSGDLHGEKLLQELYALNPHLRVKGVGGPKMRAIGMDCMMPMEDFQVMGFTDVVCSFAKLYKKFNLIKKEILASKPKGVITIDYPEFNLRMAQSLTKKGSSAKRIHYICPSVWVWRKGRILTMERSLDQVLTILPFEASLFSNGPLDAKYVGHPLIASIGNHSYDPHWKKQYGIEKTRPILSIFPGSRENEIRRNLPLQIKVAKNIQTKNQDLLVVLSCADKKFLPLFRQQSKDLTIINQHHSYELMRASHLAIATSGTVTLELALHHIPTVVTYALNALDLFMINNIYKIDLTYFSLPNILVKEELFPELGGSSLTEETLYQKVQELMLSEHKRSKCIEKCKTINHLLGTKDASKQAALSIITLLN